MQAVPFIFIGVMALAAIVIAAINLRSPRPRPMMSGTNRWLILLSLPGILAFLAGFGVLACQTGGNRVLGLWLLGGGFLACGASVVINSLVAKAKRSQWPQVSARCIERRLEKGWSGDGDVWSWRLVCEITFSGRTYRLVPKVRWSDAGQSEWPFGSEAKARAFLERAIAPDGVCKVRINPQNPQEGELLD